MPATIEYLGGSNSTADLTAYTFADRGLGAEAPDRRIAVLVMSRSSTNNRLLASITLGGQGAAVAGQRTQNDGAASTVCGAVVFDRPAGEAADVIVTLNGTMARASIVLYRITGSPTGEAPAFKSAASGAEGTGIATSIEVPAGGVACAIAAAAAAGTATWSGLDEDRDASVEGFSNVTAAHRAFAAAAPGHPVAVDFSDSSINRIVAALVFRPSAEPPRRRRRRGFLRPGAATFYRP